MLLLKTYWEHVIGIKELPKKCRTSLLLKTGWVFEGCLLQFVLNSNFFLIIWLQQLPDPVCLEVEFRPLILLKQPD